MIARKCFALFVFLLIFNACFSQKIRKTISEKEIGTLTCKYTQTNDLDRKDSIRFVFIGFQNMHYKKIVETSSIFLIVDKANVAVKSFIKDLKAAIPMIGSTTQIEWSRKGYSLFLIGKDTGLFLAEGSKQSAGYTIIDKQAATTLLDWFKSIGFDS